MKTKYKPLSKNDYKKMFPSMNIKKNELNIYLTIDDLKIDPNIITSKTKLKPHNIEIKDQKYLTIFGKEYISESNSWTLMKSYSNVLCPENELKHFLNTYLEKHQIFFKKCLKGTNSKIDFVYYYHYSNNIGIGFSKEVIKLLSKYNLYVDFDLYCLYDE